jgi:streptogramin lyase
MACVAALRHYRARHDWRMLPVRCNVNALGMFMRKSFFYLCNLRALASVLASLCFLSESALAQVVTEFAAGISTASGPAFITAGPDGNLWFTESDGNRIGRITPLGVVTEFSVGITADANLIGITAGPDGNLWFTENATGQIGRITPLGVVTEFSAGISAGAHPVGITAGPDGNLWFTELDRIGRITPLGVVTEFSSGITVGAGVNAITVGPDKNLWFTEYSMNRIGRITTLGVVTEFTGATVGSVEDITSGPDGNLWFTEVNGFGIGRITPLGVVSEFHLGAGDMPRNIIAGPDGNLWFTETGGTLQLIGRIVRITPLGAITEFTSGISIGTYPSGITVGRDGNLWFTEPGPNRIGRISTGVPAPTIVAIEYYYAAWDSYFETSFPDEIAALDDGAFGGVWKRTGQTFNVWPQPSGDASPTCRFFTTAFPPKSSHFYTPFASECASLQAGLVWQYEGIAFYIQLADATGVCGGETTSLYRLYNNGMGGVPNHRYTTSGAVLDQMTAAGWIFEGDSNTKVFACVPL